MNNFKWESMGEGMQAGRRFEYDLFGNIRETSDYKLGVQALRSKYKNKTVPIYEAMDLVKKHQPAEWDPINPPKPFLKDLKLEISDLLKLDEEELDGIEAYTAVDSLLDKDFGIDAFLTFSKKKDRGLTKNFFITYDSTLDQNKQRSKNYNTILIDEIVIPDADEGNKEKEEVYLAKVREIAGYSVDRLRSLGY